MSRLIFEVGVEELPLGEFSNIKSQLIELFNKEVKDKNLNYKHILTFVAPRRFGFYVEGLPTKAKDKIEKKRGPAKSIAFDKEGNPTKALLGFLKSNNASLEDIKIDSIQGREYVFLERKILGKEIKELLKEILPNILKNLKFKKPMKWGNGQWSFVRPVHWILALFENEVIDFELFGVESARFTYGKRFFSDKVIIENPKDYFEILRENFVIADEEERKKRIESELKRISTNHGVEIEADEELVDEIIKLTEYPSALVGSFDEKFLELPEEIIEVTIKHHQRSFVVRRNKKITNLFVFFQDGIDRENNLIKGYSRVVNARLDDAKFYYWDDLKVSIEKRFENLKGILYYKDLGTYMDKVYRMSQLSKFIGEILGFENTKLIEKAALLSKIDIASNVVYEFPELQGIMGRIYLEYKGEKPEIALTSQEHYKPFEENDSLPSGLIPSIVSIADKIDDLVGYFSLGKIPTGSKDPFALKRKAYGLLRIIIENEWDLDIKNLFDYAANLINRKYPEDKLKNFIISRFNTYLDRNNIRFDIIRSVMIKWYKPFRAYLAASALNKLIETAKFKEFVIAFQRVYNISKNHNSLRYEGKLFIKDAEKELFNKYLEIRSLIEKELERLNYSAALEHLITLKPYIDRYFDNVFVMDPDESIRLNRLGFLKSLSNLFMEICDVTQLYKLEE